ncbi:MAG TPA: amino acid ABC transporter permease [Acetobacteraceae bacterium]|nr:amino acid ABC transporter permease [Acetobacteraceae bacterium]
MIFDFSGTLARWPELLQGAGTTLFLALAAMVGGTVIGGVAAAAALSRFRVVRVLPRAYVETIRNTPFLVQVYIVYFGLPAIGIRFAPVPAAVISLSVYAGAYVSEILRAGIEAVPRGQIEAARSLGLSALATLRHVVIGQALAAVFPALASQFILVMLASSLVSAISVQELTGAANDIQGQTFRSFEAFLVVAALYLAMTGLLRTGLSGAERRLCRFKFAGR